MYFFYKKTLVAYCLFGMLLLVACDNKFPLNPDILLGKSKNEIIALSMKFAKRTSANEVNFSLKNKYGHFENFYYSSKEQAEQDINLLNSNVWDVFFTKQKTLLGHHYKYIRITFRDGYVYNVEINTISDAF